MPIQSCTGISGVTVGLLKRSERCLGNDQGMQDCEGGYGYHEPEEPFNVANVDPTKFQHMLTQSGSKRLPMSKHPNTGSALQTILGVLDPSSTSTFHKITLHTMYIHHKARLKVCLLLAELARGYLPYLAGESR